MPARPLDFKNIPSDLENLISTFSSEPKEGLIRLTKDAMSPVYLPDATIERMRHLVNQILDIGSPKLGVWMSWDDVMKRVANWMVERFENPAFMPIKDQMVAFQSEYDTFRNSEDKSRVYIPIYGIQLKIAPFELGRIKVSDLQRCGMEENWQKKLTNSDLLDHSPFIAGELDRNTVIFTYEGVGTPSRLAEVGREHALMALNLLRYTVTWDQFHRDGVLIDIYGGEPRERYNQFIVEGKGGDEVNFSRWRLGPRMDLVLDEDWKTLADGVMLWELSKLAIKTSPTKFETSMLRAVYWFGNYQSQLTLDNQLLSLATSIESCFGTSTEDRITQMISEGLALISQDTPAERVAVRDEFKKLYGKRSKLTHGEGEGKSIDWEDVQAMERHARNVISFIIPRINNFTSNHDFKKFLDNVKLGSPLQVAKED